MAGESNKTDLVVTQGQYAYVQEETKGTVKVHVGPAVITPSGNERPVWYDSVGGKFVSCALTEAARQNPVAGEGHYLVLENPSKDGNHPSGTANAVELEIGRKVNIPGPMTFALWPGQAAKVIQGHQLKSNEYIMVRVYNIEEAKKNWPLRAFNKEDDVDPEKMVIGQLLVIKGTDVSFFIPPTGLEVLQDSDNGGKFVRQAITLERLEYCILRDEDGNKRYEKGPTVVFPRATETFVYKPKDSAAEMPSTEGQEREKSRSVKFKAIELNDQMGLYIKVIADYNEEVGNVPKIAHQDYVRPPDLLEKDGKLWRSRKAGEELFITGKDQRIYYPIPEHAIISYGDDKAGFARQRYYGIAVPKGEARYVLDKNSGKVNLVRGEKVFLPDPRHEVIVRRVLDQRTAALWYPGNEEVKQYNASLSVLAENTSNYVQDLTYNAALDMTRQMNRGTSGSSQLRASSAIMADTMKRGTQFTPPPMITLNTKYDGPPTIGVWTGYAVQVVDKSGKRRVVHGPDTVLLEYDETLERMQLSTGKPKNTDKLYDTVYLRVSNNRVSDIVKVETKDMVTAEIKVSYRVNFEGDSNKWFAVENYVKLLTDHCRSRLRAKIKHLSVKELIDESSSIVRNTVLGDHAEGQQRLGMTFAENGMRIYDVEVLATEIPDDNISRLIIDSQQSAVKETLSLTAKQQQLETQKKISAIDQEIAELKSQTSLRLIDLERKEDEAHHNANLYSIEEEGLQSLERSKAGLEASRIEAERQDVLLEQRIKVDTQRIKVEQELAGVFKDRMGAVNEKLVSVLQTTSDRSLVQGLIDSVAPLAVLEQQGVGPVVKRLFSGTNIGEKMEELLTAGNGNGHKN